MTQQKSERNNNTKKTVVIVALLLALIALLCFGGYTFSKYVTSDKGTGTANVAKWGYTVTVEGDNLFGKKYEFDNTNSVVNEKATSVSVAASTDAQRNVVAPGTTGKIIFKVKGTAEVTAKLNIEIKNIQDISLTAKKTGEADAVYYPIKWTLKKNGTAVATDVKLSEIPDKLNVTDEVIKANTDLGTDYGT